MYCNDNHDVTTTITAKKCTLPPAGKAARGGKEKTQNRQCTEMENDSTSWYETYSAGEEVEVSSLLVEHILNLLLDLTGGDHEKERK